MRVTVSRWEDHNNLSLPGETSSGETEVENHPDPFQRRRAAGWQESNRQPATAPHPLQRQRAAGWPWSDFPVLYQRRRLAGAKQLRPPRVLRKPQEQIAAPIPTAD